MRLQKHLNTIINHGYFAFYGLNPGQINLLSIRPAPLTPVPGRQVGWPGPLPRNPPGTGWFCIGGNSLLPSPLPGAGSAGEESDGIILLRNKKVCYFAKLCLPLRYGMVRHFIAFFSVPARGWARAKP